MGPRGWYIGWVTVVAAVSLVGFTAAAGCSSGSPQSIGPTAPPTASPTVSLATTATQRPTIPSIKEFPVIVPALPETFTPPPKRACPEDWRRISDDRTNYSFCLPPGWAILDSGSSEPSSRTTIHFESAAILSPEGFPYPYAGSYEKGIRDLVRDSEKNIVWMQLFYIGADSIQPMSCDSKPGEALGGLPSAGCENHFDIPSGTDLAVPDANGGWDRRFVTVPLPNAGVPPGYENLPYPTPTGGYSWALGILFEGRNDALDRYWGVIDQILGTLEGQT